MTDEKLHWPTLTISRERAESGLTKLLGSAKPARLLRIRTDFTGGLLGCLVVELDVLSDTWSIPSAR